MSIKATLTAQEWFSEKAGRKGQAPHILKAVGVEIRVRLLIKDPSDWEYLKETLEDARRYGSAEVVEYLEFVR